MDYLSDAQPKKQDAKHAAAVGMIYEMQRAAIVDIRPYEADEPGLRALVEEHRRNWACHDFLSRSS